ncbi:HAD family hydrolase [Agaribacterium sp. ZY112]|uniref:HAD family hydrolase n=1 Tax=Agaribacterium sp. ZY112 TaxID=3233574 RepID=UPI00352447C6
MALRIISALALSLVLLGCKEQQTDALPSWNNNTSKQQIIEFVEQTTNSDSEHYVPVSERIAVFDNDGTLWAEQPMYFQLFFVLDQIKKQASQHPEWKNTQPFKAALEGDIATLEKGGMKAVMTLLMATHAGMSTEEFKLEVSNWLSNSVHPTTKRAYTDMIYQPMLEVLNYMRSKGFKTFIVSGGGIEFIRVFSEEVYGIPPEQVIGSSIKTGFSWQEGKPIIQRLPEINFIDDKEGKPLAINHHIGRRPIAAFGNSDGDHQMLQWTDAGKGLSLKVLVHHTDAQREWAYDKTSSIGKLDKALLEAQEKNWTVINMKNDWRTVFPNIE